LIDHTGVGRRQFVFGAAGALLLPGCAQARPERVDLSARLAAIEKAGGGRLGAYVLDTGSGRSLGWRADERFAMCSTFKLSLAALALRDEQVGRIRLDEPIAFSRADLLPNSPETEKRVGEGHMSVAELSEAAQLYSDNAAANLLLRRLGGPSALTRFWRELGDTRTRLDRFEPELNRVAPGETHDTTTPETMARSVARFAAGDVLTPPNRARLGEWMERTATGTKRIRAALPAGWRGGDKTGTASYKGLASKLNDIAVLHPPGGGAPLVVTAYYESSDSSGTLRPDDETVLRSVGEVAVTWAS
jgi:beta-lactamase class A